MAVQVKDVCSLVAIRSARLVAAVLSGLLLHLERAGVRGGRAKHDQSHADLPRHTNLAPDRFPSTGALLHDGLPMPTQARHCSWTHMREMSETVV